MENNTENPVLEVATSIDEHGQEVERRVFDGSGQLTLHTFFIYNSDGQLTGSLAKNGSGNILNYIEYSYDAGGRLAKRTFFDAHKQLLAYHAWTYAPDSNRLLEYSKYGRSDTFKIRKTFHYDAQGLLVEERHYASQNKLLILKKKQYDYKNREKGEFIFDGTNALKARKLVLRDHNGQPIEISWYDPSDRIQRLECFDYRADNALANEIIIDFFGNRSFFRHYTTFGKIEYVLRKQNRQPVGEEMYEYDSANRLALRKRYLIAGSKRRLVEKEIHYYEP